MTKQAVLGHLVLARHIVDLDPRWTEVALVFLAEGIGVGLYLDSVLVWMTLDR